MLQTHPRKLMVIIAEAVLERTLVTEARALGAMGYTVIDVRGGGMHGDHDGEWDADRQIELQLICSPEVAERIAAQVLATYAPNYRVSVYLADVSVFRKDRF